VQQQPGTEKPWKRYAGLDGVSGMRSKYLDKVQVKLDRTAIRLYRRLYGTRFEGLARHRVGVLEQEIRRRGGEIP